MCYLLRKNAFWVSVLTTSVSSVNNGNFLNVGVDLSKESGLLTLISVGGAATLTRRG